MYSLAYVSASSVAPGGVLTVEGQLLLNQRTPITSQAYNGLYNSPILNCSVGRNVKLAQSAFSVVFEELIGEYVWRNYSTTYSNQYPVWKAGPGNTFKLVAKIQIPPNQVVWYRPQTIEMLKFGWIQFLATFICLWWFYTYLEVFIFNYRIVQTRVTSDNQSLKGQKF
jgi:transmembrane protein 231